MNVMFFEPYVQKIPHTKFSDQISSLVFFPDCNALDNDTSDHLTLVQRHQFPFQGLTLSYLCLQIYLASVVWTCHDFENNFGNEAYKFTDYLKETCRWSSNEQLPFKYFLDIAFFRYIFKIVWQL